VEESNRHTKADPLRLARRRLAPLELASLEGKQHLVAEVLQLLPTVFSAVCRLRSLFLRWFFWSSPGCHEMCKFSLHFLLSWDGVRASKPCMCTHGIVVNRH